MDNKPIVIGIDYGRAGGDRTAINGVLQPLIDDAQKKRKALKAFARMGALPGARFYDSRVGTYRSGKISMSKKERRLNK